MIDPDAFIHPQAIVENDDIGPGTRVYAFVHILPGAVIGSDCNINDHCLIEGDVVLGDRVTVKCFNYLVEGITAEDDVFLGPSVVYTNDINPRSKRYPEKFERIYIKKNASIGANSVLLGGITVGRYALVGIGSVVTRDVPDHALVYGNPARQHGWACHCGNRLIPAKEGKEGSFSCSCGNSYTIAGGEVTLTGSGSGGER
ncbi:MAG: N-acetyltransferase [Candidatus Krumholzibacteriota bacterium]|nr:N-acetyltransferase [Candidatus Krumholzibacteriota bacterium]